MICVRSARQPTQLSSTRNRRYCGTGWRRAALIADAMSDQDVRGLVLAGPAGVGKTRLALEAVRAADPRRSAATQAEEALPAIPDD
jgi:ATP/maltotriose-dependent transcriptional regulator MalT